MEQTRVVVRVLKTGKFLVVKETFIPETDEIRSQDVLLWADKKEEAEYSKYAILI